MNPIDARNVSNIIANVNETQAANYCRQCSGGKADCHHGRDGHYKGWFPAICHDLSTYFAAEGLAAFFSHTTSGGNEFLLDFVVLEAESDHGSPRNVVRTIPGREVEWCVAVSDAGAERDFNKLLCFHAPLKVFVYCCKVQDRDSFKDSIERRLRHFRCHREGDEYLIVEFYWRKHWVREKRLFRISNGEVCELSIR